MPSVTFILLCPQAAPNPAFNFDGNRCVANPLDIAETADLVADHDRAMKFHARNGNSNDPATGTSLSCRLQGPFDTAANRRKCRHADWCRQALQLCAQQARPSGQVRRCRAVLRMNQPCPLITWISSANQRHLQRVVISLSAIRIQLATQQERRISL